MESAISENTVSSENKTLLAYRLIPTSSVLIDVKNSEFKPKLNERGQKALKKGLTAFRKECGNAFIVGIKYAHWFSGTANWELKESDRLSKRTITQNLSVEGPTYGVEQDFEHRVKNSNTSVVKKLKVRSKGSISTGARTYDGLKDEFDEFPGRVEGRSGGDLHDGGWLV